MLLVVMASSGEIVPFDAVVVSCAAAVFLFEWIGSLESWRHHLRHRELRFPKRCMSG
jgi:hypothetical protein